MTERTRQRGMILLPVLICLISILGISAFWLRGYRQTAFEHVSKFCQIVIENNPEAEPQILSSLKAYYAYPEQEIKGNAFLAQYGYRSSGFCKGIQWKFFALSASAFLATACGFVVSIWHWNRRVQMRITELTNYLEQVNVGAGGTVIQTKEDAFSQLQDEMYKTVTTLYQTRENAVKAKVNFAENLANIAHQLKTPITAAFLSLQLMKKNITVQTELCTCCKVREDTFRLRRIRHFAEGKLKMCPIPLQCSRRLNCNRKTTPNVYAGQIEKQLERLNQLEESLLTLSKIDAGTLYLEHSKVDIYTALNLAAENLDDLLKKEHVSVSVPDRGCIEIDGDLEWTMEALINLMKNCMEHSPRGGTIHCDYSRNPLYAEILIWDEGRGFEAEDIPHLFERFYRGKGAAGNGIGIGLSLARSIFELQNGNITARNLPEGGACFEIRIQFR